MKWILIVPGTYLLATLVCIPTHSSLINGLDVTNPSPFQLMVWVAMMIGIGVWIARRNRPPTEETALWVRISERHHDEKGYDLEGIANDQDLDENGRHAAAEKQRRLGRYAATGI